MLENSCRSISKVILRLKSPIKGHLGFLSTIEVMPIDMIPALLGIGTLPEIEVT